LEAHSCPEIIINTNCKDRRQCISLAHQMMLLHFKYPPLLKSLRNPNVSMSSDYPTY
ncbi:hypothetical protein J6590_107286, partial [Homalodisca vitripennis]